MTANLEILKMDFNKYLLMYEKMFNEHLDNTETNDFNKNVLYKSIWENSPKVRKVHQKLNRLGYKLNRYLNILN